MAPRPIIIALSLMALAGCSTAPVQQAPLFDRLGGMPAFTAAAEIIVSSVSQDPRTSRTFDGINLKTLKASVAVHLCSVTGGPCRYEGESMAKAHAGMGLSDGEFDVMGVFVDRAFERQGAKAADRKELAVLLGRMRPDVVQK